MDQPTRSKPLISIVIVLYNSEKVIYDCLNSIIKYACNPEIIEIILVDNFPGSEFGKIIAPFQKQSRINIIYISNPENGGFGQGNNLGVKNSSGNLIFFLNPDTILMPGFSYNKIINITRHDENIVVGFKLIDLQGKENNSYSNFPEQSLLSFLYNMIRKNVFLLPNFVKIINKAIWPWGAAFVVHKKKFLEAGQFDEKMFLCNEEPDLMKRLPDRKITLLNMSIVHLEGHTTESSSYRFKSYMDSAIYYILKHQFNKDFFLKSIIFREKLKFKLMKSKVAEEKLKILKEYL